MMSLAGSRGALASLILQDMAQRFQWSSGHFAGFTCIGCFDPAHASAGSLREMVRVTRPEGSDLFAFGRRP